MWQFLSRFLDVKVDEEVQEPTARNPEIKTVTRSSDEHDNHCCRDHTGENFNFDCLEENKNKNKNEKGAKEFRDFVVNHADMEEKGELLSASISVEKKSEIFGEINTSKTSDEPISDSGSRVDEASNKISTISFPSSNETARKYSKEEKDVPLVNGSDQDFQIDGISVGTIVTQNFDRESYIHNTVVPKLKEFATKESWYDLGNIIRSKRTEKGDENIQKNMCQYYKLWSRVQLMDINHMIVLLTTLGQWHGWNLAFQDQNPEEFHIWTGKLNNVMSNYFEKESFLRIIIKNMKKVLKMLESNGYHELVDKYMKKMGFLGDILLRKTNEVSVIAFHADCWIDNIVFGYKITGGVLKPSDASFANVQLSMVDSPIKDLSYLFYTYSDEDTLQDFDFLLQVYHHALTNTMERLGSDANNVFSFEKLKKEWRKYGMFGVIMNLFEMFDDGDVDKHGRGIIDPTLDQKIHEEYNSRVLNLFVHFGKNFL
ncbi:uncharacterized protein LOC123318373 [Coccinella septempunctata]|uniref:uncharacterized protein LOC123318373 n=1 Tax=Coccinella septempunctata TaxID=41139 RepID=UPI001D087A6F|nr:uncharacterized protein LOC123318373 [Coccinella septempunctata]